MLAYCKESNDIFFNYTEVAKVLCNEKCWEANEIIQKSHVLVGPFHIHVMKKHRNILTMAFLSLLPSLSMFEWDCVHMVSPHLVNLSKLTPVS